MSMLEKMLEEEKTLFVAQESFIRLFGAHIRGLPRTPTQQDIDVHLNACRDYYKTFNTRDGVCTPWISGRYVDVTQKRD